MNIHLLLHFADCVCNCGPLWGYSCFSFESNLKTHFHGTRSMSAQVKYMCTGTCTCIICVYVHVLCVRACVITCGIFWYAACLLICDGTNTHKRVNGFVSQPVRVIRHYVLQIHTCRYKDIYVCTHVHTAELYYQTAWSLDHSETLHWSQMCNVQCTRCATWILSWDQHSIGLLFNEEVAHKRGCARDARID